MNRTQTLRKKAAAITAKVREHRVSREHIGTHIIADFWGCTYNEDPDFILTLLKAAADASSAEVLDEVIHEFEPDGLTAILLLAESHISIHTWPEYDYVAIDVFTCGKDMRPELALKVFEESLNPTKKHTRLIKRGKKDSGPRDR